MKANNFEQTINQVPKEWGIKIPDSIDDACKSYYHILMVRRTHIPEQETYKTTSYVQQYDHTSWNRKGGVKENLGLLGYTKCFVLHDPTKKEEIVEEKKPAGRPKKQTEAED